MTASEPRASTAHPSPRKNTTGWATGIKEYLDSRAGLDYLMLRIIIFLLIGIGVIMVFSSSMATSYVQSTGVWTEAIRQTLMVGVGLFLFWIALRFRPSFVRKLVPWVLLLSIILLVAVLIPGIGTGREEVGSQSWIILGPMSLQPSELARVAIGLFGATTLADKVHTSFNLRDPFTMYSLIAAMMFGLIIAQGDVGMAMSFAVVVIFTLFFAGVNWSVIAILAVIAVLAALGLFLGGGFRSDRFHTYFDALRGDIADTQGTGFQAYQGFLSLADGGLTGVGIGQSRAKWFYLPEAKNDFVFAILGEELGLLGGALVIVLFALLGFFGIRTAMRAQNQFQALMAATLTAGVVAQAFFNIGYVVGLLPVTGIQLPMISAGGTSAIITIASMGLLANVARHEPMQISAMQNYGRPLFDRIFNIPEPDPIDGVARRGRHSAPSRRAASRTTAQVTAERANENGMGRDPEGEVLHRAQGGDYRRADGRRAGYNREQTRRGETRRARDAEREKRFGQAVTDNRRPREKR
ncbi:cell division protein FtsW [Corynebacterium ammoniagenes]|uniref:FtsW/RodA/SpoVE family cell cycle protein n=1 Tax=Corynebacterium ammoniagenes TaxID=1697 RepID=UPI001459CF81|nr:putative peptidoglycan glycosyltransferase FtsW [Corynebacterium ammoniagenes]NMF31091.1 cell division protein FtsW [Corynebacterium ammoniagenes]